LSSPPQYVSGGSALIQRATNAPASKSVIVKINGTDVSSMFTATGSTGVTQGVATGMVTGSNTITAKIGSTTSSLEVTNYPITGPIISGPHLSPFECQTATFALPDGTKLGAATDTDCSAATKVTYIYMPTGGTAFKAMPSTTTLPADVATTTTLAGATVPFVVRVETGTIDRGIYQNAVLHNPTTEAQPTPLVPPKAWNKRLIAIEGFGCPGGWYIQGGAIGNLSIAGFNLNNLDPTRLGEGYATFSNTLQHPSNNCNAVLASEAAMMSKEHFIKTYGVPTFTVSAGCSGGSYGSMQPADIIPGLFDGVLVMCTFPDPLAIAFSGSDGHLLTHYFATTNPTGFSTAQQVSVSGYKSLQAFHDAANQAGRTDPVSSRIDITGYVAGTFNAVVPVGLRYDPTANPTGARGDVYDWNRNVFGIDPTTGFALRPYDNVGVQYGLAALNDGSITVDQFIDMNANIGGYDANDNYVTTRTVGDPGAIQRMYQSGLQLSGNGGLSAIPIMDVTGIYNDDGGYHYQWFHFATRERLARANGNADNQVMWRGNPVPATTAWATFIQWVAAYKADTTGATLRQRAIESKPTQAVDGCWSDATHFTAETQTLSNTANTTCNTLFPSWTAPRLRAGSPVSADITKCQLKAIDQSDYTTPLTAAQLTQLQAVFPAGVCDWSKTGVNQTGVVPRPSFGPSPINLIFDVSKR
ncbi:MAG: DUF6351 family protein, partial [Janthinobacterium lividum]